MRKSPPTRPLPSGRIGVVTAHLICFLLVAIALAAGAYFAAQVAPNHHKLGFALLILTGLLHRLLRPGRKIPSSASACSTCALAAQRHRSVSETAQELIEEGLRMQECPGLLCLGAGRPNTQKSSGPVWPFWEVLRDFVHDKDGDRLQRAFPQLSRSQVTAALIYYTRYCR